MFKAITSIVAADLPFVKGAEPHLLADLDFCLPVLLSCGMISPMRRAATVLTASFAAALLMTLLQPAGAAPSPLAGAVVVIIRHAEKPESGVGLSPAGDRHAQAYVSYFDTYRVDGQLFHPTHLFVAADTAHSHRPSLTLMPLSAALHLPVDPRFRVTQADALAADLQAHDYGGRILICWRHGEIPALLTALGAPVSALLPNGEWPDTQFGWVIELHYDAQGHLLAAQSRRVVERITF